MFGMGTGVAPLLWSPEHDSGSAEGAPPGLAMDGERPVCIGLLPEGRRCRGQAGWLISTARLRTLLPLHLRPIDQVFYLEPSGRPCGCPGMPRVSGRASRLDAFSGYPFST